MHERSKIQLFTTSEYAGISTQNYNFFEQVPDRMTVQWFNLRREKDHADLSSPKLII